MRICVLVPLSFVYNLVSLGMFSRISGRVLKQSKDADVMLKMGIHRISENNIDWCEMQWRKDSPELIVVPSLEVCALECSPRGVHDVFNFVGAGSATAAVFGLISTWYITTHSAFSFALMTLFFFFFLTSTLMTHLDKHVHFCASLSLTTLWHWHCSGRVSCLACAEFDARFSSWSYSLLPCSL